MSNVYTFLVIYVNSKSISFKMWFSEQNNLKNCGFLQLSQFAIFAKWGLLKMYLLPHFSIFLAKTFRIAGKLLLLLLL